MLELARNREQETTRLGGDPSADDAAGSPLATVHSWLHAERLPVVGMTVAMVRHRYADRFDLDPAAQAVLDGNDVGNDAIVGPGQVLRFMRRAGEKGVL